MNQLAQSLGTLLNRGSTVEGRDYLKINDGLRHVMVATGQDIVREKEFFKVREMSRNFILNQ